MEKVLVAHASRMGAPDLAERPTWLFQIGPCGADALEHAELSGDFRDWDAIQTWADGIAEALKSAQRAAAR